MSWFIMEKCKKVPKVSKCKHSHFSGDFNKVEGIGDCTDQWIQRSSNPKAQ